MNLAEDAKKCSAQTVE